MSQTEVQVLQEKLAKCQAKVAKREHKIKEFEGNVRLLREKLHLSDQLFGKVQVLKGELKEERERRMAAEQALEEQRQETAAAARLAQQAQHEAEAATEVAKAAMAEAVGAAGQLAVVQEQMQRLQAQCQSLQKAVAAAQAAQVQQVQVQQGAAQPAPQQAAAAPEGWREQLQLLQSQQTNLFAELQRWRAALAPLAALAAAVHGAPAALAAPPAAPALPAPGAETGAAVTSPRKQRQQRPRQQGPTSPRQVPQAKEAAAPAAADQAGAAPAAPAPVPAPAPEDARARAVAARQAAASGKRPRSAANAAAAPAPAHVDAFAGMLAAPEANKNPAAKRARYAIEAPPAVVKASTAQKSKELHKPPAGMPQPAAAAAGTATGHSRAPVATAAVAAEASLAISANELAMEQQREQATAADEAAQLLGRITACGPLPADAGGGTSPCSLTLPVAHSVAAELQLRLADERVPLQVLLTCYETAVLECAAPKPQLQYLRYLHPAPDSEQVQGQAQQAAAAAAAASAAQAWIEPNMPGAQEQQQQQQQQAGDGSEAPPLPPFAAVWCSREALARHCLHWLLHCAAHMQKLEKQYAAAAEAAAAVGPPRGPAGRSKQPFLPSLRQHLHRSVVSSCVTASQRGGGSAGGVSGAGPTGDFSSALRHTETEVCALAAAAAGLCRLMGNAEAFWALLLDLVCCPAPAAVVLPPLAAALDMWPALVLPVQAGQSAGGVPTSAAASAAGGGCGGPGGLSLARCHAALQWLCSLVSKGEGQGVEEDAEPTDAAALLSCPPPLLLERQPAAAALFLHRLGRQRWGWEEGAAGSSGAREELKAALQQPLAQHQQAPERPEEEPPPPSPPQAAPKADLPPAIKPHPAGADADMADVEVEEI